MKGEERGTDKQNDNIEYNRTNEWHEQREGRWVVVVVTLESYYESTVESFHQPMMENKNNKPNDNGELLFRCCNLLLLNSWPLFTTEAGLN